MKKVLVTFLSMCGVLSMILPIYLEGYMINPFTDICWDCVFPITVSGVNVTSGHLDQIDYHTSFCFCSGTPPKAGIPISFWEPKYIVDVTRHPYQLVGLGGISIGKETYQNRGSIGIQGEGSVQNSFYHVHLYRFPALSLLDTFSDFKCVQQEGLDCVYLSEFDLLWNDEEWANIMHPEAYLFRSTPAQVACIADCLGSSFSQPLDKLFWCAGCHGSLYPFTGFVGHHVSGLQASSLLIQRVLAKLHRSLLLKGYTKENFCEAQFLPLFKKSIYKTHLLYPKGQTKGPCHPLGKTDLIWGMGKSYPIEGEDFVYMLWTKKQCCLDAIKPASKAILGGP